MKKLGVEPLINEPYATNKTPIIPKETKATGFTELKTVDGNIMPEVPEEVVQAERDPTEEEVMMMMV